jgi:hypothetical protein
MRSGMMDFTSSVRTGIAPGRLPAVEDVRRWACRFARSARTALTPGLLLSNRGTVERVALRATDMALPEPRLRPEQLALVQGGGAAVYQLASCRCRCRSWSVSMVGSLTRMRSRLLCPVGPPQFAGFVGWLARAGRRRVCPPRRSGHVGRQSLVRCQLSPQPRQQRALSQVRRIRLVKSAGVRCYDGDALRLPAPIFQLRIGDRIR